MIKRLVMIFTLILSVSPVFAQKGEIIKTGAEIVRGGTAAGLKETVTREVGKQILSTSAGAPVFQLGQISNWVSQPLVRIQIPQDARFTPPVQEQAEPAAIRILDWKTSEAHLFPKGRDGHTVYIPSSFHENQDPAWYRGMSITRLDELRHAVEKGMTLDKTNHYGGAFASTHKHIALGYSVRLGALYPTMPVLVKIPITPELYRVNEPIGRSDFIRKFCKDVDPSFISDILVFLEVDGKPGWYKVILEDGELVFKPVPGSIFSW